MTRFEKCNGVLVPMVSPFTAYDQIDTKAAARITEHVISNDCIPFILGTTGEAISISRIQKSRLAYAVLEKTNGRFPVYAGISSTCFEESVDLAHQLSSIGIDFLVAHLPFFYPLNSAQIKEYFTRLADNLKSPLVLYNIPATTHLSIPLDVIYELSEHPNIVAIKDSERDLNRLGQLIGFCKSGNFSHLVGWGKQITYALSLGSDGLVPSTGNIVPALYRDLFMAARNGEFETARQLQTETESVSSIYQKDRNLGESLAALKVMMHDSGLCEKNMLPPLTRLKADDEQQILANMKIGNLSRQSGEVNDKK